MFTDMINRPYPTVFAYAAAGVGKTNALRSVADRDPFVIATEDGQTKGMSTLADLHYPAVLIDNLTQLQSVTSELQAKCKPGELYYGGLGPFRLLSLDSFTGVSFMLEDGARKLKGWDMIWDSTTGGGKDPRQAYPYIAEKGRQVLRKLMALPIPLLVLCREQNVTEGEGKNAITYPAPEIAGQKLPKELPGWPEATVRLRMLNDKRIMVTENEGNAIARVRLKPGLRLPKHCKIDFGALFDLLITSDAKHIERLRLDTPPAQGAPAAPAAPPPVLVSQK